MAQPCTTPGCTNYKADGAAGCYACLEIAAYGRGSISRIPDVWTNVHAILSNVPHALTADEIFDRQRFVSCTSLHRIKLVLSDAYNREWVYCGVREHTREWTYSLTDAGRTSLQQATGEPPVPQTPPRVYQTPEIDSHNERCQAAAALDFITEYLRADSTWAETRAKLKILLAD